MLPTLIRKPKSAIFYAVTLSLSAKGSAVFSTVLHPQPRPSTETHALTKSALQSLVLSHYHHGKFHSLLQNVVASPLILLTACHNLRKHGPESTPLPPLTLDSVSTHFFSLQDLSFQLSKNSLDVESCCVPIFGESHKEIQEIRLKTNKENPRINENELVSGESYLDTVFYKPLKIYAVRCLDEILIITSGTKMLTMDLKNRVRKFLEQNLDLKVDKLKTAIHSAVSEKIEFMGMELQAVPPSVLRPPITEKAIRARKKYLRQKEVRLLELKNAKERNRKKLGMKILNHVFKKLKRSKDGLKTDFPIKNEEVRQIFSTWGDEVVHDFLKSVDDRWELHRKLTAGDFFSLERIRDQLPRDLVDAYDKFQHQVDKYLKPVKAKKELEEEVRRKEQEDEEKYAKKTVEDLTKRCIKVDAPMELIRKAVKTVGFTNHMGRPRPISLLTVLEDADIIKWYAGVGRRWLDFYNCCNNLRKVKIIVGYHLRFSCILTLAEKHEATKRDAMRHFTKDLKVCEEVHFPSEREIKMMGDRNLGDPKPVDGAVTLALIRLASDEPSHRCIAHFCERIDTIVYRIRLLQDHLNLKTLDENSWIPQMGAIHDSLGRKCVPLCSHHVSELYMGRLTLQDLDSASFLDVG